MVHTHRPKMTVHILFILEGRIPFVRSRLASASRPHLSWSSDHLPSYWLEYIARRSKRAKQKLANNQRVTMGQPKHNFLYRLSKEERHISSYTCSFVQVFRERLRPKMSPRTYCPKHRAILSPDQLQPHRRVLEAHSASALKPQRINMKSKDPESFPSWFKWLATRSRRSRRTMNGSIANMRYFSISAAS